MTLKKVFSDAVAIAVSVVCSFLVTIISTCSLPDAICSDWQVRVL
jgi:hypothetical protein